MNDYRLIDQTDLVKGYIEELIDGMAKEEQISREYLSHVNAAFDVEHMFNGCHSYNVTMECYIANEKFASIFTVACDYETGFPNMSEIENGVESMLMKMGNTIKNECA